MKNNPGLFIIIPVFNRKDFTRQCLLSLNKQTNRNFSVVIIDDGSTDGTEEMIRNDFLQVILIKGSGNLWWTKATNLGVKYALELNAEYILTLNNDTVVAEDYIEKMLYWASKKKDTLLGSLALDFNSREPIYGGEIINWKKVNSTFLLNTLHPDQHHGLHKISHYSGRGFLIPAEVFTKIGFYDEKNFPHYGADDDFALRAGRNGFEIYCNYDAKLCIRIEESSERKLREKKSIRNYLLHLFSRKGGGNIKVFIIFTFKNCPLKYLPSFLIIGLIKRIFGYLIDWYKGV